MSKCIEWTGAKNGYGYGLVRLHDGRRLIAHRYLYERVRGPVDRKMMVCHKCDNRGCVRLSHLFVGSAKENVADMVRKNRVRHGSKHPKAKLNEESVLVIKRKLLDGYSPCGLAREYGVNKKVIYDISSGKIWGRVRLDVGTRRDFSDIITN